MSKGVFITGTGTDVGKTYVSALLLGSMLEAGYSCGYYKAALSGASSFEESDAGFVKRFAKLSQTEDTLLSYRYRAPVSPHLAAQWEGNPVCIEKIRYDYAAVCGEYPFVVVEGSGGIVCPLRWEETEHILQEDIVTELALPTLVVADAGLGTINASVLTVHYLKSRNIPIKGIVLNHFTGTAMQNDTAKMIEELTGVPILAFVKENDQTLSLSKDRLEMLFAEVIPCA